MIQTGAILDHFDKDGLTALADAFKIIHASGVLLLQVEFNSQQVAKGFQERTPEELVVHIMQVQQTNRNLLALHEWAGNFNKEMDNA